MASCGKICDIFCGTNIFLDLFSLNYYNISHKCNKEKKMRERKKKKILVPKHKYLKNC